MGGRKSAFGWTLANGLPDRSWIMEALDRAVADKRLFEKVRSEPMGRRADEHTVWRRQRLQSRREVRGVADDGLFSCHAYACCFTDDDEPGCNSYAGLKRRSVRLRLSDSFHDFKTSAHGAFGRVFLGLRKAEIHKDAVTQILRDEAIMFRNRRHAGFAILAQQDDKIFRIKLSAEFCRAHQIDKNDSDLATLDCRPCRRKLRRCRRSRLCHPLRRRHELSSVSERESQFLQILLSQIRNHRQIDIVVSKNLAIFFEAEALQPELEIRHPKLPWRHGRSRPRQRVRRSIVIPVSLLLF